MQFRSLRSPIAVILMLSMVSSLTIGGFAKPASAGAPAWVGFMSLAIGMGAGLKGFSGDDNTMRADFTHRAIDAAQREIPGYNVVIVNRQIDHKVEGQNVESDFIQVKGYTYIVYLSPQGRPFKFVLNGDGGWINWASTGNFDRQGKTLTAR